MPPQSSGNNRPRRRRNRQLRGNAQVLTVSRQEFLGSVLPGNGGFNGQYLFVYPQETTVVAIARSYSEYRYTKFHVRLVPRASTSTLGTHFAGFLHTVPVAITQLSHVAPLQGFAVGQAYESRVVARLDTRARRQTWFPMLQTDLTDAQSVSPDIVQAWLFNGTQSVQSGVTTADLHVSYTIQFRGPRAIDPTPALTSIGRVYQAAQLGNESSDSETDPEN